MLMFLNPGGYAWEEETSEKPRTSYGLPTPGIRGRLLLKRKEGATGKKVTTPRLSGGGQKRILLVAARVNPRDLP